ncbi:hypothetical protein [Sphingobium sp.]|uniref:hypothetical protein n=1 Tax=Sphingobium sp. TaxID=1912891 RepID=UPI002C218372|nr:hypothetical protein [Sphingobium sp.]HUD95545.1 hypothetical protein [Sphingobium sp.]
MRVGGIITTTLERAARALCSLQGLPEKTKVEGRPMWESFLPSARAVLQAIREPSPEMLMIEPPLPSQGFYTEDAWRLMIDAALAQRP